MTQKAYTEPQITPSNPSASDMAQDWAVWFRYLDHTTGKWKMKTYKAGINRYHNYRERLAEANALRKALAEELQAGWNPLTNTGPKQVQTVLQAMDYIVDLKSKTLRKKSLSTYRHITRLFAEWLTQEKMKDLPITGLTPIICQQHLDQLVTGRGYSARTHNDHLIILSTIFNAVVERAWMPVNPFAKIKRMQTTVGRNLAYTAHERASLIKVLREQDPWMYYLTQIMYFCFIRRTELIRLKVGDFDLVNHTIVLRAEVSKNKRQESVVIPRGLEPVLEKMKLQHYPPDHYVFGRYLLPSDLQFSNENHVTTRHTKFVRKLGIDPEKGLYSWKHTGVVDAYYATGKDVYSVMRQLRHRSLETTMVYLKSLGLVQNDVFRDAMR